MGTIERTAACWGSQFPTRSAVARLVALAIADLDPSGNVEATDAWYERMVERTGQPRRSVRHALVDLCDVDVLSWIGRTDDGADRYWWRWRA